MTLSLSRAAQLEVVVSFVCTVSFAKATNGVWQWQQSAIASAAHSSHRLLNDRRPRKYLVHSCTQAMVELHQ